MIYRDKFLPDELKNHVVIDESQRPVIQLPSDFTLLALSSKRDPDVRACLNYVLSRGLSERDLWFYKIGVSDDIRWRRRVIVPSFDRDGRLNYYVGRAIDQKRRPKYDSPDIDDKAPIVFNEINVDWTKLLVLCEGAFDSFKCGDNSVPLLGSSLNEKSALFSAIITNKTPVALALDADMLQKKVPRIAKKLSVYDVDVKVVDVSPWSDPGSMTKQEFKTALRAAKPLSWDSVFASKLSRASETAMSLT